MAQIIPNEYGHISGRIGKGFGKALAEGLSEQVPKEAERYRLSQGLKQLEQGNANLSPFQQFSRLAAIPGITPQMIQSGSELLRQQARGQALGEKRGPERFPIPPGTTQRAGASTVPSITKPTPLEKIQQGYIPPTQEQIISEAGRVYNERPELFGYDPQKAIDYAETAAQREEKVLGAYQKQHEDLTKLQNNVVDKLKNQAEKFGVSIPGNIYSSIEDKAIQATKPVSEGGRGLTEQQAMREYGKELDDVSRDYEAINSIGNWSVLARPARETLSNLKSLQHKFEKRNDTENFADKLISTQSLSPIVAYSIAQPVYKTNQLSNELKNLPNLGENDNLKTDVISGKYLTDRKNKTLEASEKLANGLGKKGSPLAVAYELQKKGYDASAWLDYLNSHRDELGLTEAQGRQLDKPNSITGTLNDWWLQSWTGIE